MTQDRRHRRSSLRVSLSRLAFPTTRRFAVLVVLLLIGGSSVVAVGIGAGAGTPSHSSTNQTQTLIIRANGPSKYLVSVTGTVTTKKVEPSDIVQLPVIQGAVGASGDSVDIIKFTGHIVSFKQRGTLRVTLDGRRVEPTVLDGTYIQLASQRNGTTRYQLVTSGRIVPGGSAEPDDYTTNRSQVEGSVNGTDTTDAFYYTGELSRARARHNLTVVINSRQVPVVKGTSSTPRSSPSGTPPPTSKPPNHQTSSPVDGPTAVATVSPPHAPSRTASGEIGRRSDVSDADGSRGGTGSGGLSLLELGGGIVLMGAIAIGGIILILR